MTEFTMIDREYNHLAELLTKIAPGFAGSGEYARLDLGDLALPTVVCGAFNRYFCRLQNEAATRVEFDAAKARELRDAYRAIDHLSESKDPEVVNLVVVEIFEHLDFDDTTLEVFKNQLGKTARGLYHRWITVASP